MLKIPICCLEEILCRLMLVGFSGHTHESRIFLNVPNLSSFTRFTGVVNVGMHRLRSLFVFMTHGTDVLVLRAKAFVKYSRVKERM